MTGDWWKAIVAVVAGLLAWKIFGLLLGFLTLLAVGIFLMSREF